MSTFTFAYAAIHRETGKVLHNLDGHYSIYSDRKSAERECPDYGEVRKVRVTVVLKKEKMK